jgi:hypothetical protein
MMGSDSPVSPGDFAALVATGASMLVATVLFSMRSRFLASITPFMKLVAGFLAFSAIHHAVVGLLALMLLRRLIPSDDPSKHYAVLVLPALAVLGLTIWDLLCLLRRTAATKSGYGTRFFDVSSVAFTEGALPVTQADARFRYAVAVSSVGLASAVATAAPFIAMFDHFQGTPRSVVTIGVWFVAFVPLALFPRVVRAFRGAADVHADRYPASLRLHEHPGSTAAKGRVLSKQEAAQELEG